MIRVGAGTRVTAVLGDPIRHSLSPVLFNAAFADAGLDWVMAAFEVPLGAAEAAVAGIRGMRVAGASVTYPLKAPVAQLVDRLDGDAAALGVVNSVSWDGDRLVGATTDGEGLVAALRAEGLEPAGTRVVLAGAGGAARAIALALVRAGAEIGILNRSAAAAADLAEMAGPEARVARSGDVETADIVVNATTVGMAGGPVGAAFDTGRLRPTQAVVDIVYHPRRTALLEAAGATGCRVVDGTGMLLHQAALQFERWTASRAPLAAMREALEAALTGR